MISRMYEEKLKRDLFRLSVASLITVVVWIGMATYKSLTKNQIKPEVKKQILPLTPTIDAETMNDVRQRLVVPKANWDSLGYSLPESVVQKEASSSGELVLPEVGASESAQLEASAGAEL